MSSNYAPFESVMQDRCRLERSPCRQNFTKTRADILRAPGGEPTFGWRRSTRAADKASFGETYRRRFFRGTTQVHGHKDWKKSLGLGLDFCMHPQLFITILLSRVALIIHLTTIAPADHKPKHPLNK